MKMSTNKVKPPGGSPEGLGEVGFVASPGSISDEASDKNKSDRKKIHPPPANQAAKDQLKKLKLLGYNNFEETGITFWEPKREKENDRAYNGRRQKESTAMNEWIKAKAAEKGVSIVQRFRQGSILIYHHHASQVQCDNQIKLRSYGELERRTTKSS